MNLRLRLLHERPELHHRERAAARVDAACAARLRLRPQQAQLAAGFRDLHQRGDIEPFADVAQCLEQLSRSYVLGVLTNGNADVFRLSLGKYFNCFQCRGAGGGKPQAQHFNAALAAAQTNAGTASTSRTITSTTCSAHSLGITTVWFNPDDRVARRRSAEGRLGPSAGWLPDQRTGVQLAAFHRSFRGILRSTSALTARYDRPSA
jgi:putative hydrolase of the HAD superfamily